MLLQGHRHECLAGDHLLVPMGAFDCLAVNEDIVQARFPLRTGIANTSWFLTIGAKNPGAE